MYPIVIPLKNQLLTEESKADYLQALKESKATCALIIPRNTRGDQEETKKECESLRRNASYFAANGIEPAVWIAATIGHGAPLQGISNTRQSNEVQPLVTLEGVEIPSTACPLDPKFQKDLGEYVAQIARYSGVKLIFLDDDFRLSQRGKSFCCACDLHLAEIASLCGESLTREQLRKLAFTQKPNRYRAAWLKAQGESLERLAKRIREQVDLVAPDTSIALCSAHSLWGVDGTSPIRLAQILAGKNQPVARLHPAPYWAVHSSLTLPTIFEMARTFASFAKDSGVTLYSEGDVYPRPRYNTPASYLELFDAVLRADGTYHGIFKYILDYTSPFSYETGYAKYHKKNLPLLESITRIFAQKTGYGVYIPIDQNDFSYADFTISDAFQNNYPLATAGKFLSSLSIPTTYQRNAYRCTALAGETAQRYPLSELQSDSGAILDAVAALHLQKRGLDVGLSDTDIRFLTSNAQGLRSKENDFTVCHKRNNGRFAIANLKRECRVLLEMTVAGEGRIPFFYQYQNADGMRFLVCLADWMGFSQDSYVMRGYPIQNVLMDASEWISGARLPVRIEKQPELYVICKRSEDGQKMSVGLFNCFADAVLSPTVTLDTEYRNACFFGCDGRLEQDRIYLQADIPAFSFAAFEVTK